LAANLQKYFDKETLDSFSKEELIELNIMYDPKEWAKDRLAWMARDYQADMLDKLVDSKQMVFRWGRRLGKSDTLCIAALYYAETQLNASFEKGSYKVLIICPFETQIDEIFDRLKVIVQNSPKLADSVKCMHHKIKFLNGSVIQGKTAGSKSNKGAASLRGKGADVVMFDEVDYMNDKEINNIMQLKKEDPGRIRILAASTPTGNRNLYYRWCTEAEDLGWTHSHVPSTVNKTLYDINPENKMGLTYMEEMEMQMTQLEFLQEVMAEFGDNQRSLFQKRFLDQAIALGKEKDLKYDDVTKEKPIKRGPRILGVDWDRASAATNMVILEFNKFDSMFYPIQRVEVPSHEFTYTEAVGKIIFLNERYDLDYIYVDKGYGETQIEILKKYGMQNPETGLLEKVKGIQFGSKIEIRDPHTKQKVKKDVKPFMVNNAVNVFEKGIIALNPKDHKTKKQLEDYAIKNTTNSGKPQYVSQNEHIVDCICLALFGFEQQYGSMFNLALTSRMVAFSRDMSEENQHWKDANEKPRVQAIRSNGKVITATRQNITSFNRMKLGNKPRDIFSSNRRRSF
jgi:hypothetical protein